MSHPSCLVLLGIVNLLRHKLAPNNAGPKPCYLLPLGAKHYMQRSRSSPTKVYQVGSSIPEVHVFNTA